MHHHAQPGMRPQCGHDHRPARFLAQLRPPPACHPGRSTPGGDRRFFAAPASKARAGTHSHLLRGRVGLTPAAAGQPTPRSLPARTGSPGRPRRSRQPGGVVALSRPAAGAPHAGNQLPGAIPGQRGGRAAGAGAPAHASAAAPRARQPAQRFGGAGSRHAVQAPKNQRAGGRHSDGCRPRHRGAPRPHRRIWQPGPVAAPGRRFPT
jgi:hypothetical protein